MITRQNRKSRQRGNTMIEFALAMTFLIPLMVGSFTLGINLMRTIQVTQLCRDAGSMYSRSVDFTLTGSQTMLVKMATGLGMTLTGGNGNVILSKVTFISDADCTGQGLAGAACSNRGKYVFMQRIYVGNKALRSSAFGTPNESGINATTRLVNNIYTDTSAQCNGFGTILTMTSTADSSYLVETFFQGAGWNLPGTNIGNQIYTRGIF
jgi:Flp pilus assembly protein TadG